VATVTLNPWSPAWPAGFAAVAAELGALFRPATVGIEHIGSTAVPGLVAKPVLDVLLGAQTLAVIEARIERLGEHGYEYVSKYEAELPQRRYFVKPASGAALRIHVHGVEQGSPFWRQHLAFRDALRRDQRLRAEYQALKLRLAALHAADKAAYTDAKGPFIRATLAALGLPVAPAD
jgi:GrpB-like predicted nucleotidyltransferase (UPF0157 family)